MAQEQDITFITEDIPPATSFIQSGRSLRVSYVGRKEAKYINDIILQNIADPKKQTDPNKITPEFWEMVRSNWKQEALIKYPDEGDYKVWIIDPVTNLPVPLGESVEYIGGDIRETPGGLPCTEYILDLKAATIPDPSTYQVAISYEDCFLRPQRASGTALEMDGFSICVGRGLPMTSIGVFIVGVVCDLNYGIIECSEYSWDLSGLPLETIVSLGFKNCDEIDEKIEGTPRELGLLVSFCAKKDSPVAASGVITYIGGPCVLDPK